MQYQGNKKPIARYILPIMMEGRRPTQYYVEPFMGGANLFCLVDGPKIGADINPYLVELWRGVVAGRSLRDIDYSRENFQRIKRLHATVAFEDWDDPFIVAAMAYIPTYSGKFFDSYAITNARGDDYIRQRIGSIERQIEGMYKAKLVTAQYYELDYPPNSIIYLDPPYKDTTRYNKTAAFNHSEFYDWVHTMHWLGHTLYMSEYTAPRGFTEVWRKHILSKLGGGSNNLRTERLFKYLP